MSTEETLYAQRVKKLDELRQKGLDHYANDFYVETSGATFVQKYGAEPSAEALGKITSQHSVACRVMAVNTFGKACFLRIQDGTSDELGPDGQPAGRLQLFVQKNKV